LNSISGAGVLAIIGAPEKEHKQTLMVTEFTHAKKEKNLVKKCPPSRKGSLWRFILEKERSGGIPL